MEMFYILVVIRVTWVYTFVKAYWTVSCTVYLILYKLYTNKVFFSFNKAYHCFLFETFPSFSKFLHFHDVFYSFLIIAS
jgi:hypothetical protein